MLDFLRTFLEDYGFFLLEGVRDTMIMVLVTTVFAYLFGLPIGVIVTITQSHSLRPNKVLNGILGWVVNMGRSLPFAILLIALRPLTQSLVGTFIGVKGIIFPLVVATTPFVARLVESSLKEVDNGVIELAQSTGSTLFQIIWKVMIPESLPSLFTGIPITLITLFGYSAMGGFVGSGGLGDIAIRYGYHRFDMNMMIATIILLVILVQIIQSLGNVFSRKLDKRIQKKT